MTAYFDIENLESLLSQPKDDFFLDCRKLMKKQLDLSFNFNKEELKKSEALMQFVKDLTEGIGEKKIKYIPEKFPKRKLDRTTINDFTRENLLSLYFINDESIEEVMSKKEILIANVGQELDLFKILFLNTNDNELSDIYTPADFASWSKLRDYHAPLTDIIIIDTFLLKNTDQFENNFFELLENLIPDEKNEIINIVIFCKTNEVKVKFEWLENEIKTRTKKITGYDPNVTLITSVRIHDRSILTNHMYINSGDTFNNYFYPVTKKLKTRGDFIVFNSLARINHYNHYFKILDKYQEILNEKSTLIEGAKVCKFLNFP